MDSLSFASRNTTESSDDILLQSISPLLRDEAEGRSTIATDTDTPRSSRPTTIRSWRCSYHSPTEPTTLDEQESSTETSHKKAKIWKRGDIKFQSTWTWEIGGICLSSMVAIIATLPYLSDNPLSHWQFLMAPNTMISTFTTIMKTSMLLVIAEGISQLKWLYFQTDSHPIMDLQYFDSASRGPWGSPIFLLHARGRTLIASFGAFVTAAALAMDPFGQQIISFETRYVPHKGANATVPVAYAFELDFNNYKIMPAFEGAVARGLYDLGGSLPVICPTGNCTWPRLTTLGICSSCEDITNATVLSSYSLSISNQYDGTNLTEVTNGTEEGTTTSNFIDGSPKYNAKKIRMNVSFLTPNNVSLTYSLINNVTSTNYTLSDFCKDYSPQAGILLGTAPVVDNDYYEEVVYLDTSKGRAISNEKEEVRGCGSPASCHSFSMDSRGGGRTG